MGKKFQCYSAPSVQYYTPRQSQFCQPQVIIQAPSYQFQAAKTNPQVRTDSYSAAPKQASSLKTWDQSPVVDFDSADAEEFGLEANPKGYDGMKFYKAKINGVPYLAVHDTRKNVNSQFYVIPESEAESILNYCNRSKPKSHGLWTEDAGKQSNHWKKAPETLIKKIQHREACENSGVEVDKFLSNPGPESPQPPAMPESLDKKVEPDTQATPQTTKFTRVSKIPSRTTESQPCTREKVLSDSIVYELKHKLQNQTNSNGLDKCSPKTQLVRDSSDINKQAAKDFFEFDDFSISQPMNLIEEKPNPKRTPLRTPIESSPVERVSFYEKANLTHRAVGSESKVELLKPSVKGLDAAPKKQQAQTLDFDPSGTAPKAAPAAKPAEVKSTKPKSNPKIEVFSRLKPGDQSCDIGDSATIKNSPGFIVNTQKGSLGLVYVTDDNKFMAFRFSPDYRGNSIMLEMAKADSKEEAWRAALEKRGSYFLTQNQVGINFPNQEIGVNFLKFLYNQNEVNINMALNEVLNQIGLELGSNGSPKIRQSK